MLPVVRYIENEAKFDKGKMKLESSLKCKR